MLMLQPVSVSQSFNSCENCRDQFLISKLQILSLFVKAKNFQNQVRQIVIN
jgi:hypothetical protein